MKSRFTFRKQFEGLFDQLGVQDKTVLQEVVDPISKRASNRLVNPRRMVLRRMLEKTFSEQLQSLQNLKTLVEQKRQQREKDNKDLENS